MPPERKTPAPQRRQAEGDTGVDVAPRSVPGWQRKRRAASLVRFGGHYSTPEALHAQFAAEAAQQRAERESVCGVDTRQLTHVPATQTAVPDSSWCVDGPNGEATPLVGRRHPADRSPHPEAVFDGRTGEVLPCRFIETTQPKPDARTLTTGHRKVANALSWNVAHLCQKYGIERVGFLTLTFADHVVCAREASRRFNSLATHVLRPRYEHYIRVLERQKSGRIHYHLLVVLRDDIRTGVDFDQFTAGRYTSAGKLLRLEWAFWRKTAPVYRFGRTELMPIRSNADALGQYVGKYIGKHIGERTEEDKGVRLVSYAGDARMATSKHTALTSHPDQWRAKVATFCRQVEQWKRQTNPNARIRCMDDLAVHLGKRWAYKWRAYICDLPPADLSVPF